jgi:hypothetical protein
MNDVPQSEAIALLSHRLICEDAPAWSYNKMRPGMTQLVCGLVQEDGSRSGLYVQLIFARSLKTKICTFKFSVFRTRLSGHMRVYQVQVNAVAHNPKNWHDQVHEHMGDARIEGDQSWLKWTFDQALDYFSKRANITFIPPLLDPEVFELTS